MPRHGPLKIIFYLFISVCRNSWAEQLATPLEGVALFVNKDPLKLWNFDFVDVF